jgi:hypothetical protein
MSGQRRVRDMRRGSAASATRAVAFDITG